MASWVPFQFVSTRLDSQVRGSIVFTAQQVVYVAPDRARPEQVGGYYVDALVERVIHDTQQRFGWEDPLASAGAGSSSGGSVEPTPPQMSGISLGSGSRHLVYVALGTQAGPMVAGGRYVGFPSLAGYRPAGPDGRKAIDVGFAARVWRVDERGDVQVESWNDVAGGMCERFTLPEASLDRVIRALRQGTIDPSRIADTCASTCGAAGNCVLGDTCTKVEYVVPKDRCRTGGFFVDGESAGVPVVAPDPGTRP